MFAAFYAAIMEAEPKLEAGRVSEDRSETCELRFDGSRSKPIVGNKGTWKGKLSATTASCRVRLAKFGIFILNHDLL